MRKWIPSILIGVLILSIGATVRVPTSSGTFNTTGPGLTNSGGTISLSITNGANITLTTNASGVVSIASTGGGGGGVAGTVVNTGASTTSKVPLYSDTTGTNVAPASITTILDLIGSTQGTLLYRNGSVWTPLAPGSNGQLLQSGGAAANPSWTTFAGGTAGTVINTGASVSGYVPTYSDTTGTNVAPTVVTGTGAIVKSTNPALTNMVSVGVVALSDGATIATDASLGNTFRVTLAGNRTLSNPTNGKDGQKGVWELIQDGTGSRTITMDTKFAFGTDITGITLTTTASKHDFITAIYNSTADKWYVVGFVRGY